MMVRKIFFDMDGVLADFDRGIRELCGIPSLNQEAEDKAEDERMWAAVRDTDHFYDRLELMPGAEKMFRLLYKKYGSCCEILTAIPKAERGITSAGEDKIRWVRRLLSENIPVHIVYKEEKKDYCTGKDCILIDDYSTNIKDWEAFGGTGILFKNAAETLRALTELGTLTPETVEELVEVWKDKKDLYRERFNHGWPAKLVHTSFLFKGMEYNLTPEAFGLEEEGAWGHGLMECFQADLEADLREMGAVNIYSNGFID